MFDLDLNLPNLTDEGAKALGVAFGAVGERATENLAKCVPSQSTTQMVAGMIFILGAGWLALAFYKESKRGGPVEHFVEHHDRAGRR